MLVRALKFARLLLHALFQCVSPGKFSVLRLQLAAHAVERVSQFAKFVL